MCASSTVRGRRVWLWLSLGLAGAMAASGCATKKDLKLLRNEMLALQSHQDSLFKETQRQNRLLLDTLRASLSVQMDAQGQTSHRFQQLEQQLGRTEAILQQMQLSMANFTDQLDRQAATNPVRPAGNGGTATAQPTAGEADEAYTAGMDKMQQGAYSSARYTFEFFLERFPTDPRAVEVQFQLAETYAQEADIERAITELVKLETTYGSTYQAKSAEALLRAGVLAEERLDNKTRAREFYQTVTRRYPNTEAYREAQRRLSART
jgi:TolA-binding protein